MILSRVTKAVVVGVLACIPIAACSPEFSTCSDSRSCQDAAPSSAGTDGGENAGDGASPGGSSGTGGTGTAGHAGTVGGGSGAGGASGATGSPPCNDECTGLTPVCDTASNECVQCLIGDDCEAPTPACDPATNACVECMKSRDCKNATKPFCDASAQKCMACLKQADCSSPTASACNGGLCMACTTDAECSNIAGKGVCDVGTCVQCTGKKFAACGQDSGTPLVCDSLKKTCTTSKQASAGLCKTCVSDAQCAAGEMCVLDKFGSPTQEIGYFCHWMKGATGDGAPSDCFATGRPYSATLNGAVSIDGTLSDICTLNKSTCIALNQFGKKDCKNGAGPDDSACGFSLGVDAKCAQIDSSTSYRCTMTCGGPNEDCPGTACDTGKSPFQCQLQ